MTEFPLIEFVLPLGLFLSRVLLGYLGVVPSQIEMSILVDFFSVSA